MDETQRQLLKSHARGYIAMHPVLKYVEILVHAAKEYGTEEERSAFRDAVLDADVARNLEHRR